MPSLGSKHSAHGASDDLRKPGGLPAHGPVPVPSPCTTCTCRPPHLAMALPSACDSTSILPRGKADVTFVLILLPALGEPLEGPGTPWVWSLGHQVLRELAPSTHLLQDLLSPNLAPMDKKALVRPPPCPLLKSSQSTCSAGSPSYTPQNHTAADWLSPAQLPAFSPPFYAAGLRYCRHGNRSRGSRHLQEAGLGTPSSWALLHPGLG